MGYNPSSLSFLSPPLPFLPFSFVSSSFLPFVPSPHVQGAAVGQSNMWSMYPVWPAEHYAPFAASSSSSSSSSSSTPDVVGLAQASARTYLDLVKGRPVQVYAAAVRAGVTGSVRTKKSLIKQAC